MIIEIASPDVGALIRQRVQAGAFQNPEDLLRELLLSSDTAETCTGVDLVAAMRACPYPQADIEPRRVPSPLAGDVNL